MAQGKKVEGANRGSGAVSLLKRRVTDVAVSDGGWIPAVHPDDYQNEADIPWFVYVWPSSNGQPLGELRLYRGDDVEQWVDDTDLVWPADARRELHEQLPKLERKLPTIAVSGELPAIRDRAVEALISANNPPIFFRRGGLVTEIALNEKRVPSAKPVTTVRMRDRLGEVARWEAKDGRGNTYPTKPPSDIASNLLETPGLVLPSLDSIVEFPVMGQDGHISVRRGYDPATATYFAPSAPLRSLRVNEPNGSPGQAEAHAALSRLSEMFIDFDFESHADKTNVLALMLTPVLRPIIDGPVPLAGVRAVKAGTGKSLLVKTAFTVLAGREPAPTGLGRDEDEAEKRLTAALLAGGPFVFLDNIKTGTVLESAALARALTAQVWEGRVITTSKYPSLPIRCTWVATGNNLTFSDEIARRTYMIELASKVERPDLRPPGEFRHPDLLSWVREHRADLLTSLLVLARAWSVNGMSITEGPVLSSFESWSTVVGSVLRFAGLIDFLGNEDRKRDLAEDDSNLERGILLARIHETIGDRKFTLKELHGLTQSDEEMGFAVSPFLDPKTSWQDREAVKQLGYRIRTFRDGTYGEFKLVKVGSGREGTVYAVTTVAM